MFKKYRFIVIGLSLFVAFSCDKTAKNKETNIPETTKTAVTSPNFSAETAYQFVAKQVTFGPRVPNTTAHKQCGDWMVTTLKSFGLEVKEQPFVATTYDGKTLKARNIIASFNPTATKRILLAAHWDARPFADKDDERQTQAIDGANDGASGVGVLLEIARSLTKATEKPTVGVDFVFFDAEDWGAPASYTGKTDDFGGYCLGSTYWSKNLHTPNYSAFYGILLDMVGGKGATFRPDSFSNQVAPTVVQNVWNTASQLGYSQFFISEEGGGLVDDHVPVVQNAKIPMIDIIDLKPSEKTFFDAHHTHDDNMNVIDKVTLKAVGQTILQVLYQE
jgi:glutaminyl-peptide cyclotransferase